MRARGTIGKLAIAFAASAALSACTSISERQSENLSRSGAVFVTVSSQDTEFRFPKLPARPTAAEGAGAGALEGAAVTVGEALMTDPFAILLLPIMIPAGAVIGAATVPDDAEWNRIETKYNRLKDAQLRIHSELPRRNAAREIETGIVSAFREVSESCIAPVRNAPRCSGQEPVSVVSVVIQPVIEADGYTLRTATAIRSPGMAAPRCVSRDYKRLYGRAVAEGRKTAASARQEIEDMYAAFGRLLAFELYDAPRRRLAKEIGPARSDASKGLGLPHQGELACKFPAGFFAPAP